MPCHDAGGKLEHAVGASQPRNPHNANSLILVRRSVHGEHSHVAVFDAELRQQRVVQLSDSADPNEDDARSYTVTRVRSFTWEMVVPGVLRVSSRAFGGGQITARYKCEYTWYHSYIHMNVTSPTTGGQP